MEIGLASRSTREAEFQLTPCSGTPYGEAMMNLDRREFFGTAGKAALGLAAAGVQRSEAAAATGKRSLRPGLVLNGTAALSRPSLAPSQLSFRIGLARTRTKAYPMDSMDFILMDLERPEGCSRHAHWCTGDLTGRLLEFLSCAEQVDGQSDPRLPILFERILRQRRPSGLFSRYHEQSGNPSEEHFRAGSGRLFAGLVRYLELTGDRRAREAAEGLAARLWSQRDAWRSHLHACSSRAIEAWIGEPFARLYGITRDPRWIEFCGMIREFMGTCEVNCHSHGYMSTLRGLQAAALMTGDVSWNEKPELNRRLIIDKHYELPGGGISENFPRSTRDEGCSIADWMMLNLNAGLILGDDAAYAKAEHSFWNALSFNQWITGSFGHRALTPYGYGYPLEEAWWCCVHHAGMAMSELARHVVTRRNGALHVNFLVPGQFFVPWTDGTEIQVTIETPYPARAEARIEAVGLPEGAKITLRIPACVRQAEVAETRAGRKVQLVFKGRLGHRLEACKPGVTLTYGPLVLVPASYGFGSARLSDADRQAPAGYVPEALPAGTPTLRLGGKPDADGFLNLESGPLPAWSFWDEGRQSRTWIEGAAVTVPVQLSDGTVRPLRFTPMGYNTSCLALFETPVVFREG